MDVNHPALEHCPTRSRLAAWREGVALCHLDELGRGAVDGSRAIQLALASGDDEPGLGARELHGAFYETVQYFLQVESRAADGLENPRGCGFSSMCLRQLLLQISVRARDALLRMPRD